MRQWCVPYAKLVISPIVPSEMKGVVAAVLKAVRGGSSSSSSGAMRALRCQARRGGAALQVSRGPACQRLCRHPAAPCQLLQVLQPGRAPPHHVLQVWILRHLL